VEPEVVRRIAQLARIELGRGDLQRVAKDLSRILEYFDKLEELDTSQVEPLVHPLERADVLAEDVVSPSLGVEDTLANAARHDETHFLVPRILGGEK
jgi:aspartyl-tRNA(Asn)/glutamyl-tRNA(Gln) amidotransferase subunit C